MIKPEHDPDWFDSRRFVIAQPKHTGNAWGVIDLRTNKMIVDGISVEESGLYADACEARYNSTADVEVLK